MYCRWCALHWITRVSILSVLVALLSWQSRFTWSIHNPMYGWPMPFANIFYQDGEEWLASILILDAVVWLVMVSSVGYTIEYWQRKKQRWQFNIGSLIVLHTVIAIIIVFGCIEKYLRFHPNNDSLLPLYARWDYGSITIWFDIGLFTDPPQFWLLNRIIIIFGIGCVVYAAVCILCFVIRQIQTIISRLMGYYMPEITQLPEINIENSSDPRENRNSRCFSKDPLIARVVIWILYAALVFFSLNSLTPGL